MKNLKRSLLVALSLCLVVQAPPKKRKPKKTSGGATAAAVADVAASTTTLALRRGGGAGGSASVGELPAHVVKILEALRSKLPVLCLEGDALATVRSAVLAKAGQLACAGADKGGRGRVADNRNIASQNRLMSLGLVRTPMNMVVKSLKELILQFGKISSAESIPVYASIMELWPAIEKSFEYKADDFKNEKLLQDRFFKQFDFICAFEQVYAALSRCENALVAIASVRGLYETFLDLGESSGVRLARSIDLINDATAPLRGEPVVGRRVIEDGVADSLELAPVLPAGPLSMLYWDILELQKKHYPGRPLGEWFVFFDWKDLTNSTLERFYLPLSKAFELPLTRPENIPFMVQKKLAQALAGIICETVRFLHAKYHSSHEDVALQCFNMHLDVCSFLPGDFVSPLVANIYYHKLDSLREKFDQPGYLFRNADFDFVADACLTGEIRFDAMFFKISRIPFLPADEMWERSAQYIDCERTMKLYFEGLGEIVAPVAKPVDVSTFTGAGAKSLSSKKGSDKPDCHRPLMLNLFGVFAEEAGAGRPLGDGVLDFTVGAKPALLAKIERLCEAAPLHVHILNHNLFVFAYLYGNYEAVDLERQLRNLLTSYKDCADASDRDLSSARGAAEAKGAMSVERMMIIVSAIKQLLFAREDELDRDVCLAIFNEVFGLGLTAETYIFLQGWFGLDERSDGALGDLDAFLAALGDCPGLRAMLEEYSAHDA